MNGKILMVLVLLAAGLGTVLWLTDQKPAVSKVAELAVLDGRTLRDCTWMRWRFRERPAIEVTRRDDGQFQITEPIVDLASAARMKQLLDVWDSAQMQASKVPADEAGLSQSGLQTPEVVFQAKWADGTRHEVAVGGPGPLDDRDTRYVQRDGKVWVGSVALLESLRMGLDDLRERQVFRHAFLQANEVKIDQRLASGRREVLQLRRVGDDWQLQAPVVGRADAAEAQRLVTAVLALRADDFPAGKLTLPATDPTAIVTVRGDHGEETLKFWEDAGQIYGLLPGRNLAFVSAGNQYTSIFADAVDRLRARVLVPMGDSMFEELAEAILDPGQGRGERIRLVREAAAAGWRLVEPIDFEAAPTPVNEVAHALQQMVAVQFADEATTDDPRALDPRYGLLPKDRLAVTVRGLRDDKPITLWLGADTTFAGTAAVFACRADEPNTVVLVPKSAVDPLRRPFVDYCARRILKQAVLIERLELEHRDGRKRSYHLDNGVWKVDGGGAAAPRPEVGELANDSLRDLDGTKAVDARGEAFVRHDFVVVLMRRNRDEFARLRVWDRGPDQVLVVQLTTPGIPAGPVAFELGHALSKQVRELWL